MRNDLRGAHAVALPRESRIAALFAGSDLADAFAIALPPTGTRDVLALARWVLGHPVPWVSFLLRLRDRIVRPFGVKTTAELRAAPRSAGEDRIDIFRIHAVTANEVIVGEDDRHLDFRASILLRQRPGLPDEVIVTTVVHCHNLMGRLYLAAILPFHCVIARTMLDTAARRGWPGS
jgi:hypothetical protein